MTRRHATRRAAVLLALLAGLTSCKSHRTISVHSDPPGATVRIDEEVFGRTPLEIPFQDYGHRRLTLYLAGYRPFSELVKIRRPWYARFPLAIITELLVPLGIDDHRRFHVTLEPDVQMAEEPDFEGITARARAVRDHVLLPVEASPAPEPDTPPAGEEPEGEAPSPTTPPK